MGHWGPADAPNSHPTPHCLCWGRPLAAQSSANFLGSSSSQTNVKFSPWPKGEGKEGNNEKEGLCFQVESSSPLFGCSQLDLQSRSMMPWSMGWTMPRSGLLEGSPSQQASINCQHSSSNIGRRSGRAPGGRSKDTRSESVRGPSQGGTDSPGPNCAVRTSLLSSVVSFGSWYEHLG